MSYQQKENAGIIFKNDRKEKETHPDYTGTINVAGKDGQPKTFTNTQDDLPF